MMDNQKRRDAAEVVLRNMGIVNPFYLGIGNEGVVFHDAKNVYKVFIPVFCMHYDPKESIRRVLPFLWIDETKSFHSISRIVEHNGYLILIYRYEAAAHLCLNYTQEEAILFLVDCWRRQIIIKDCKPKNFIRGAKGIKLVDMDASAYDDNLFLNMCVRMFLFSTCFDHMEKAAFNKLIRTAINNFDLPELSGARDFVNRVFSSIICAESESEISRLAKPMPSQLSEMIPFSPSVNLEKIRFSKIREGKRLTGVYLDTPRLTSANYLAPSRLNLEFSRLQLTSETVSLLIKTCAQDAETIEQNIRHIVWQLSSPNPFTEIVVSVDSNGSDFLRPFNTAPSTEKLLSVLRTLVEDLVIDRYIVFDSSKSASAQINRRWFGIESAHSHSSGNVPISSQLYAFEECVGDYVLQCDSDVMVGRKDYNHSYITEMIAELRKNENVLSVGFNIYNMESKSYFGFEDGGFVPEVRMCLFDRKRLLKSRPWPNECDEAGRLKLSWYRSLQQLQRATGKCSIRGGDCRSFYVHPQNYRKTNAYSWMGILDRVEQGHIPEVQYGKFDCDGSFRDWCRPLRKEKMVVVSCFRNVPYDRFLRMWCSLMSQSFQDFGVILVDDCSDNGLPLLVDTLIRSYSDRITFIKERSHEGRLASEYLAIRYFVANPDAVIVMLDGDDALIGANTLLNVWNKYALLGADVTVGRVHQTYRLQPHYRYPVDFSNPRKAGGNVWQHLKSFRKYLFDSIPLPYLKWKNAQVKGAKRSWYERCDDYAIMVPIVEMSSNPIQMDRVNYYYERDIAHKDDFRDLKEACIRDVLSRPSLSPRQVYKGRKRFGSNEERVELDITYACDLKCKGCNRSCSQAPTHECMSVDDVRRFVQQSIKAGKRWRRINVLGGEPTLHKDFTEIISVLQNEYADAFSPETIIQVVSNGFSKRSRTMCEAIRKFRNVQINEHSYKRQWHIDYFTPFNDAPMDDSSFANADYSCGCWVTSHCGMGFNRRGWYACSVCGGIDRVLGQNHAIVSLENATEEKLREQRMFFCRYCGNFKHYAENGGEFVPRCEKSPFREAVSKTWQMIYGAS